MNDRKWKPFYVGRSGVNITHLMFAYDLLIFREVTEKKMDIVKDNIDMFCQLSGQGISK